MLFLRLVLLIGLSIFGLTAWTAPNDSVEPLEPVGSIDVNRYIGTWYEIAKFPNRFQRQCVSDTTAQYQLNPDNTLRVKNSCRLQNKAMDEAIGTARQIGNVTSPKLKVRFAPAWLSFLPFVWGDYWVIDLDPQYRWSVVSEPKREFLWILSRTPEMSQETYDGIVERLRARQFIVKNLEKTPHTPQ